MEKRVTPENPADVGDRRTGSRYPPSVEDEVQCPVIGVVCVHGIGKQDQGQTVGQVAEALARGAASLGGHLACWEPESFGSQGDW